MYKGTLLLAGLALLTSPSLLFAVEGPTLEVGQILFESTELGTVERSCSSCHAQGKGLEDVNQSDDSIIKERINRCIRNAQGGEVLDTGSQEMEALLNYIKTFRNE